MIQTKYSLAGFEHKIEFMAEIHSIMIKQVNEIKSKRLYSILKYCSLSFLSFYS